MTGLRRSAITPTGAASVFIQLHCSRASPANRPYRFTVRLMSECPIHCETITIQNNKTRATETVPASALLIYAGAVPRTDWLAGVVERDAQGYLISGQHLMLEGKRPTGWSADRDPFYLETSVPGIFVAGDVRHRSAKGVTSGVGEGAMAVKLVHQYLGLL